MEHYASKLTGMLPSETPELAPFRCCISWAQNNILHDTWQSPHFCQMIKTWLLGGDRHRIGLVMGEPLYVSIIPQGWEMVWLLL